MTLLQSGPPSSADQIHRVLISLSNPNIGQALQLREVAHRVANNFASLDLADPAKSHGRQGS